MGTEGFSVCLSGTPCKKMKYLPILPHPKNNNLAQEETYFLFLRNRRHDITITFILLSLHDLNTFKSQVIRMKKSRKERSLRAT